MNSRIILLAISVFAVGIFAMPGTLSLFSGQHSFSNNGSDVDFCRKCHDDVYVEMMWNGGDAVAGDHTGLITCKACHRTGNATDGCGFECSNFGISGSPETNVSNMSAHAAVTVECVFCHDMVVSQITGSGEAHNKFYNDSNQTGLLKGANEACVGCHTHTRVTVNYVRKGGYNITADITGGSWNLSFTMNQTNVNATVTGQ